LLVPSDTSGRAEIDSVALMHSFPKRLALLLDSTRLQQIVIFSHHDGSMFVLGPDTLRFKRAAMAVSLGFQIYPNRNRLSATL
jgi:hypothetical protein